MSRSWHRYLVYLSLLFVGLVLYRFDYLPGGYGVEYGDDQMCTLAIPSEFRNLVADYPIFLH